MSTRFGLRTIEKLFVRNPHFLFCSSFPNLRLGEHAFHHSQTKIWEGRTKHYRMRFQGEALFKGVSTRFGQLCGLQNVENCNVGSFLSTFSCVFHPRPDKCDFLLATNVCSTFQNRRFGMRNVFRPTIAGYQTPRIRRISAVGAGASVPVRIGQGLIRLQETTDRVC
jgi:hypothetical protein